MQQTSEGVAGFTGVLVERQYQPGQQYIQLVFKTMRGLKLSVTQDASLVRSLMIGQRYRIRGEVQTVGDKTYINQPTAVLAKRHTKLIASAFVIPLVGIACAGFFMTQASASKQQVDVKKANIASQQTVQSIKTPEATVSSAADDDVVETTPTETPTPTPTTPVTIKKTPTPTPIVATPTPVEAVTETPTPTPVVTVPEVPAPVIEDETPVVPEPSEPTPEVPIVP